MQKDLTYLSSTNFGKEEKLFCKNFAFLKLWNRITLELDDSGTG
jgi:hypothetical protein